MKKLLLLASFIFTPQVWASEFCTQSIQAAASPDGKCKTFANACMIPSDWKAVPSCDLIQSKKDKPSLEDRMNRRSYGKNRASRNTPQKTRSLSKYIRQGRASLSRNDRKNQSDQNVNKRKSQNFTGRKTTTRRNYSKRTRDLIKSLNIQKGGFQHEGDVTKEEREARRQYRAPIQSGTSVNRDGYLSNDPKWSVQSKTHFKATPQTRFWKNQKQTIKRKKKNRYDSQTIQLRKSYRGDRLEGSLEN